MKKIIYILIFLVLFSCKESDKKSLANQDSEQAEQENELVFTSDGDTLENGFWRYTDENSKIIKEGKYSEGYKVGEWNYRLLGKDSIIEWTYFDKNKIKFNYPENLKISNDIEYPDIFLGDIVDRSNKTCIGLLKYNLIQLNSSIYDYLYQVNEFNTSDTVKTIFGKSFKKFTFRNVDLYTVNVQQKQDGEMINIMSQVFEINECLYDLTYKDFEKNMNDLGLEIFKDMLYSFKVEDVDLFTFNNGQFLKVEDVEFE